jgi:SulP family sulfate permease
MTVREMRETPANTPRLTLLKSWSRGWVARNVPMATWLGNYDRNHLPGDSIAGSVVAITLIPQAMGYSVLAGLPPQMGLYSSLLPLIVYAVLGSSRTIGVGPVAIVSLMVGTSITPFAAAGSPEYISYTILVGLMGGLILVGLGLLRAGALTNFISHPVVAGFSTAAALIIAASQINHMLGISLERTYFIPHLLSEAYEKKANFNYLTMAIAGVSLVFLLARTDIANFLRRRNLFNQTVADLFPKVAPLLVVIVSIWLSWKYDFAGKNVKIVGNIPSGLPGLSMPQLNWGIMQQLFSAAVLIAAVSFLESISIARTLAAKSRDKVMPDQELIALGAANLGSALTGGYPVAGSFSRSTVNFATGARTQLSAIITAVLIAITLLFLTPVLYHLPQATLAAIVVMAVTSLIDFGPLMHTWRYMKLDAISFLATFMGVLIFGIEEGILIGIASSIAFFLWRTSTPSFVVLGRLGDSQLFRDARFHEVRTCSDILFLRIDMSLYFANATNLEDFVLRHVADHPKVKHFVLVGSSINMIDASALDTLEALRLRLKDSGVTMHLASIKSTILRRMRATDFLEKLAPGKVFLSPHDAGVALHCADDPCTSEDQNRTTSGPMYNI